LHGQVTFKPTKDASQETGIESWLAPRPRSSPKPDRIQVAKIIIDISTTYEDLAGGGGFGSPACPSQFWAV
jgi:hypothetical protein